MMRFLLAAAAFTALTALPTLGVAQDPGTMSFQRCAACHLPDGRGAPGVYPPLGKQVAKLAGTPGGRAYLVAVVDHGLTGPLMVEGVAYSGFMPAQAGLSDQKLADTLNHLVKTIAGSRDAAPFTAGEVKSARMATTAASAQQVFRLRPIASDASR